jgi:hypothetical protein
MNRPVLTFLSLGVGLFCLCSSAFALPFNSNASAFEKYVNSINWRDGNKRVFSQLNTCFFGGRSTYPIREQKEYIYDVAYCEFGYIMTSSPTGNKTCELTEGSNAIRYVKDYESGKTDWTWKTKNCVNRY